jgi:hypothetical protein
MKPEVPTGINTTGPKRPGRNEKSRDQLLHDQKKPRSSKDRTLGTSRTGISDSYPGGAYILARGPGAKAVTISTGCSRSVSKFPKFSPGESNEKSTTEYCMTDEQIPRQKTAKDANYIPLSESPPLQKWV